MIENEFTKKFASRFMAVIQPILLEKGQKIEKEVYDEMDMVEKGRGLKPNEVAVRKQRNLKNVFYELFYTLNV